MDKWLSEKSDGELKGTGSGRGSALPDALLRDAPGSGSLGTELEHVARRLLKRAGIFPLFSVHNPARPNVPIPSSGDPNRLVGIRVFEEMHRFQIVDEEPSTVCRIRAQNRLGEPVASIGIDWRVIPEDYVATPGCLPPPTELDATRSQRFAMYQGQFQWNDRQRSGFRGFGAGRTFPST